MAIKEFPCSENVVGVDLDCRSHEEPQRLFASRDGSTQRKKQGQKKKRGSRKSSKRRTISLADLYNSFPRIVNLLRLAVSTW